MSIADEIQRLQRLRETDVITDEEFAQAKQRVLSGALPDEPPPADSLEQQTRQWAMLLHLSQLSGFLLPLGGLIAPVLIWQLKKDELPGIDPHGRNVLNWAISALIYFLIAALLTLVVIGIPLLIALMVVAVLFPIIGGIKANDGELWRYPLSIKFL